MKIAHHLLISNIFDFSGIVGGLATGLLVWNSFVVGGALALLGMGLSHLIFVILLPARCPNCNGHTSYRRGKRPYRYECKKCYHVETTKMSTNWGG